jgi:hypothetical protein
MRGEWMWQFDNKTHLFDSACKTCSLLERANRPTTLLWSLNKLDVPKAKNGTRTRDSRKSESSQTS